MAETIKVFDYIEALDAFVVTQEFAHIATQLGITEWHPVVWLGRFFMLDNDYGEHWFDNWQEREQKEEAAQKRGIASEELMIVVPSRFQNGEDGPCHSDEMRKQFWTDVLKSLQLSYDLIFAEARRMNEEAKKLLPGVSYLPDLEERITAFQAELT